MSDPVTPVAGRLATPLLDALARARTIERFALPEMPGGVPAIGEAGQGGAAVAGTSGARFAGALDAALKGGLESVSRLGTHSDALQRAYQAGDPDAGLERTMLATQKAQVAFQAAVTVRNKLVSAYNDIMNMPL